MIALLVPLVPTCWRFLVNKIWSDAKRVLPYNLACKEAKAGRNGIAIGFLAAAGSAGYKDIKHVREDPDLEALRGTAEFEKLTAQESKTQPEVRSGDG